MQKIILGLKKLDKDTYKIIRYGLLFSGFIAIVAVAVLCFYIFSGATFFFYLGLVLLKSSFTFSVEFIICGIVVDFIRKQMV